MPGDRRVSHARAVRAADNADKSRDAENPQGSNRGNQRDSVDEVRTQVSRPLSRRSKTAAELDCEDDGEPRLDSVHDRAGARIGIVERKVERDV